MPYHNRDQLPATVRSAIPSGDGQDLFRRVVNSQLLTGRSEEVAFASAWSALENAGYKNQEGKWEKTSPTPDSVHVPSTDRKKPRKKSFDTEEIVDAMRQLLLKQQDDRELDITDPSEVPDEYFMDPVIKVDAEKRIVWGWAYVSTLNGELVKDLHGDSIDPKEMEEAADDFMLFRRSAKAMHKGRDIGLVLHSFPYTHALGKALGFCPYMHRTSFCPLSHKENTLTF